MTNYELLLDEPWTFLNARGNPVPGRRLTFQLGDDTIITLDVSKSEYRNIDAIKIKLDKEIKAHEALKALKS